MLSCALAPTSTPTPTPGQSPSLTPLSGSSGGNGNNGGNNNSGGNGSGDGSGSNGGTGGTIIPDNTLTPTFSVTPAPEMGPYVVKQIETLGHETISGFVCNIIKPFTVNAVAPEVSWVFVYAPRDGDHGNWTYAYNISKAGESHDAKGTYTLSRNNSDGTLLLTMTGSDHVVFKGFDGPFPVHYKFDLVPSPNTTCP
jgi:hypothetical protein